MAQSLSAWDVYELYRSGQYKGRPRRFFKDLQSGICEDYARKGNCAYIERKINGRGMRTTLIEFSVLQDMERYYAMGRVCRTPNGSGTFRTCSIPYRGL